jgi:hypothetical protein
VTIAFGLRNVRRSSANCNTLPATQRSPTGHRHVQSAGRVPARAEERRPLHVRQLEPAAWRRPMFSCSCAAGA